MTVTVLGATGGRGGAVVDALLDLGSPVRAVACDPAGQRARALAARGVEVVNGELTDPDALTDAFRGATAAFAVTTPFERGVEVEIEQGEAILTAAAATNLPYLVLASVASADRATGVPHFDGMARVEAMLAARDDLAATVVAPTHFYEHILGSAADIARGTLPMALPADVPLQQVSWRDFGLVVATLISDPNRWLGRRIEIAADVVTPRQMAEAVSRTVGHDVRHVEIPVAEISAANSDLGAMFAYLARTGYQVDLGSPRADFPDIPWLGFRQWAERVRWPEVV